MPSDDRAETRSPKFRKGAAPSDTIVCGAPREAFTPRSCSRSLRLSPNGGRGDVEQLRARRPDAMTELPLHVFLAVTWAERLLAKAPDANGSSAGRSLQAKDRRSCFVRLRRFWRAPRLGLRQRPWANDARGFPSFEDFEHPLSSTRTRAKPGEPCVRVTEPTEDLRSSTAPRRDVRSRRSGCLGRDVSLASTKPKLVDRPALSRLVVPADAALFGALPGECRAFGTARSAWC